MYAVCMLFWGFAFIPILYSRVPYVHRFVSVFISVCPDYWNPLVVLTILHVDAHVLNFGCYILLLFFTQIDFTYMYMYVRITLYHACSYTLYNVCVYVCVGVPIHRGSEQLRQCYM